MPFNATAADTRATIQKILASWAALVAEELGVPSPPRDVARLGSFLHCHVRWLSSHSSAGDAATEISELAGLARWTVEPRQLRVIRLGDCDQEDCGGRLTAVVQPAQGDGTAEIRCSTDDAHTWRTDQWRRLSQHPHAPRMAPKSWYSVREITQIWDIPSGSVYRHASQHQWRRVKHRGRVRYHHADVDASLGSATP
jgi:hypothetical protein